MMIKENDFISPIHFFFLVQQSGAEGEPDEPGMNTNESAGNLPQAHLPKREDNLTDMKSYETAATGEYSYVYRPKRRKITVRNAVRVATS